MKRFLKVSTVIAIVATITGASYHVYVQSNTYTKENSPDRVSIVPSVAHPGDKVQIIGKNLKGNLSLSLSTVFPDGSEKFYKIVWNGQAQNESVIYFTLPMDVAKGNYDAYIQIPYTGPQPCDESPIHCDSLTESIFVHIDFSVI